MLVTWWGGPRPCLVLIWTSTCWPAWTSQVTSVISLTGEMTPRSGNAMGCFPTRAILPGPNQQVVFRAHWVAMQLSIFENSPPPVSPSEKPVPEGGQGLRPAAWPSPLGLLVSLCDLTLCSGHTGVPKPSSLALRLPVLRQESLRSLVLQQQSVSAAAASCRCLALASAVHPSPTPTCQCPRVFTGSFPWLLEPNGHSVLVRPEVPRKGPLEAALGH